MWVVLQQDWRNKGWFAVSVHALKEDAENYVAVFERSGNQYKIQDARNVFIADEGQTSWN